MSKKNEITVMNDTESMFEAAKYLMEKKMVPSSIKRPEDITTIINMGRLIGMDPLTAINSMHVIEGNVAIKSSVIPGLLAKAGIATELIRDFEPVMERKASVIMGPDNKPMIDENGNVKYYRGADGEVLFKETQVQVDGNPEYVTTIRFHRYYDKIGKTITSDYSFYWSDAISAGWTSKSNWKKLPRFMMYARCMVRGARGCASDVIGGLYDTHEVVEFTKADFTIDPKTNEPILADYEEVN